MSTQDNSAEVATAAPAPQRGPCASSQEERQSNHRPHTDDPQRAFSVGIDLGTTHSAVASSGLDDDTAQTTPTPFDIVQVVAAGEVMAQRLLPSFLYLPASGELAAGALDLPWADGAADVIGTFARHQGAATPARLVSSAKSWLSCDGLDRRAPTLPWQAPPDVPKISARAACTRYLQHLRAAWDAANPQAPLASQDVVLTVPASFDAVARDLTVEAAEAAGLPAAQGLRLLEEPQAALYAWLADRGPGWRDALRVGDVILVCDIGGGTTDFSLIAVGEQDGSLKLERIAVGDHILLGGDNMDLALAYAVSAKLKEEGKKLDDWQMRSLVHGCRAAKEALLNDPELREYPLAIAARGSRLIGGTLRTSLRREELHGLLLDGFLPTVAANARPQRPAGRAGLTTLGLPYASDAGITRHLAAFLSRPSLPRAEGQSFVHPTAILFNGGVTRSAMVRDRIVEILSGWVEAEGGKAPSVLMGADPDLAVSRGAAYYGHMRHAGGVRIRGGTAQAYYVGVERAELAVPGIPPRVDAICIAPFGMEEGSDVELEEAFGLIVGEAVSFRFYGSSERRDDEVGAVVDPDLLTELAPIETTLQGEMGATVQVRLHAQITEVGSLQLSAVDVASQERWRLSFDVRVR